MEKRGDKRKKNKTLAGVRWILGCWRTYCLNLVPLQNINRSVTRIINWVESFLETVTGIRFLYSKI